MQIGCRKNEDSCEASGISIPAQKTSLPGMLSKISLTPPKLRLLSFPFPTINFLGAWNSVCCGNTLATCVSWGPRKEGEEKQAWAGDTGLERGAQRRLPQKEAGQRRPRPAGRPGEAPALSLGPVSPLDPNRTPPPPPAPSEEATAREAAAGSIFLLPFPDSPALLFLKSLSRAHIFSRDRVHADEDLHPTITDEICIDSKIKSNEKKIGSQPDPTVPDCCTEGAERHFFIVSRFQLTTSSSPVLPLLVWTEDQI